MNTPHPHDSPLDADERELARVVRALPGGGPPPALDARILKAAQDAVAAAPTRRRHGWKVLGSAWGASSAAAAVLALGVGWQLLNTPRNMLPASDNAPAPMASTAEKQRSTEVDFIRREPPPMTMPPSESSPAAVAVAPRQAVQTARRDEPVAVSIAEAPPEPFMDEHVAHAADKAASTAPAPIGMAAATNAAVDASSAEHDRREQSQRNESYATGAMAKASAPAAPPPPAALASEPSLQGNDSAGTLAGAAVADSVVAETAATPRARGNSESTITERHRVAADARLSRKDWLERIRQRMRDNDTSGARASLALYLERFPGSRATLPADLRRLLEQ